MFKFGNLLNKLKLTSNANVTHNVEQAATNQKAYDTKNWYSERNSIISIQRNVLFVLCIILLLIIIISIIAITNIIRTKRFDPFVIQINESTGIAQIVNPATSSVLNSNEALAQYFIRKYVTARETYNSVDFNKEAKNIVRIMSSRSVYIQYKGYLKNNIINPEIQYNQNNSTFLSVRSWSKLSKNKYLFRFSITETAGAQNTFHKIAIIKFNYVPMELTNEIKDINPVGFQVNGYRVDDDSN